MRAIDRALQMHVSLIENNLRRARQRNPDAGPEEVIRTLDRMYRSALASTGAGVGATAAVPGIGTGVALALAGGETLTSLELSALYVLSVAHVHGVRPDEIERRRTLVFGILLGRGGTETVSRMAERTGTHWGKAVVAKIPSTRIAAINRVLGRNFVTRYGTRQGILVLGKIVPAGIGAAIGGAGNLILAETTIRTTRRAFGPAPVRWGDSVGDATVSRSSGESANPV